MGVTVRVRALLGLAFAALMLLVGGCGSNPDSVSGQARAGDRKGYVSGDGSVEQIPEPKRGKALTVTGTTLDGAAWSSAGERGKVVVLNVWGSWCGPCVEEAPVLEAVYRKLQADKAPVVFMGLNFKESPESARAFVRAKSLTYPSLAFDGGAALLGLGGKAPTVPTTLLLDRQGRLAARVLGPVSQGTLTALVTDALATGTSGDRS
jgi:thiol-disulfide isomerase/thioredoxin